MGSYTGGHKQTDKRTTLRNQNLSATLGRPAMKLLCVCVCVWGGGGGGGGGRASFVMFVKR